MDSRGKIGAWFRNLRIRKGFRTSSSLAAAAGFKRTYISDLERDRMRLPADRIPALARAMNLTEQETDELARRVLWQGASPLVREALEGDSTEAGLWVFLPRELVSRIPGGAGRLPVPIDQTLQECVPAVGAVLANIELVRTGLSEETTRALVEELSRYMSNLAVAPHASGLPRLGDNRDPAVAAMRAAPSFYRAILFDSRASARRLSAPLARFAIVGPQDERWPRLLCSLDFRENENHRDFSAKLVIPGYLSAVHDWLCSRLLWPLLAPYFGATLHLYRPALRVVPTPRQLFEYLAGQAFKRKFSDPETGTSCADPFADMLWFRGPPILRDTALGEAFSRRRRPSDEGLRELMLGAQPMQNLPLVLVATLADAMFRLSQVVGFPRDQAPSDAKRIQHKLLAIGRLLARHGADPALLAGFALKPTDRTSQPPR